MDGTIPSEQTVASTENIQDLLEQAPALTQEEIDEQNQTEYIEVGANWFNGLIAAVIAIVLISIYRLVISPRHGEIARFIADRRAALEAKFDPENNEKAAYQLLSKAAAANDLQQVRAALILWSNHYFTSLDITTMEDILNQHQDTDLAQAARNIQERLFTKGVSTDDSWSAKSLMSIVQRLRANKNSKNKAMAQEQKYALPPLYRT